MNLNEVEIPDSSLPDVAVIIPCYNYGRFLKGCVDSILGYTHLDVRVIIIDDCSTDETPDICMELSRENSCISIIRHENNRGHIATYNHGLSLAKADHIHLISADDELTPFALDRAVAIMKRHSDVGMVYGRTIQGSTSTQYSACIPKQLNYSIVRGIDWIIARCRDGRNPIYSPEVTLKKVIADAVGDYDACLPLMADLEMWLRVAARSNVAVIENINQAFYRTHPDNMHIGHAKEGFTRGLRERTEAYKIFFKRDGHLLPNSQHLYNQALTRTAYDALRGARLAFDLGQQNAEALVSAIDFVQDITPNALKLLEWKIVNERIKKGSNKSLWRKILARFLARVRIWYEWQLKNRDLGSKGLKVIYSGHLPSS